VGDPSRGEGDPPTGLLRVEWLSKIEIRSEGQEAWPIGRASSFSLRFQAAPASASAYRLGTRTWAPSTPSRSLGRAATTRFGPTACSGRSHRGRVCKYFLNHKARPFSLTSVPRPYALAAPESIRGRSKERQPWQKQRDISFGLTAPPKASLGPRQILSSEMVFSSPLPTGRAHIVSAIG
jgi:hypothetical protein